MRGWLWRYSGFSGFSRGGPGVGLLLLRMACGVELIGRGLIDRQHGCAWGQGLLQVLAITLGVLVALGLWTLPVGILIAMLALLQWSGCAAPPFESLLLAAFGVALVFLGPGRWSLDARLSGWQQLRAPSRRPPTLPD